MKISLLQYLYWWFCLIIIESSRNLTMKLRFRIHFKRGWKKEFKVQSIDSSEYFSERKKKNNKFPFLNIIFPLITPLFTRSPLFIPTPFSLSLSPSFSSLLYFPGPGATCSFLHTAVHKELNSPRGPRENSRGTTRVSRDLFLFTRSLRLPTRHSQKV